VLLFERSTRRLKLSEAGRAYYATCKRVLQELMAEDVLADHATELAGKVRIGARPYGRLRVMPALLALCAQYPRLQPSIAFSDRFVDLFEERIDIAVRIGRPRTGPPRWDRCSWARAADPAAAPAYLAAAPPPAWRTGRARLHRLRRADGSPMPWLFPDGRGGQVEYRWRRRMTVGDAEAARPPCWRAWAWQLATWLVQAPTRAPSWPCGRNTTPGLPLYRAWLLARQLTPKTGTLLQELRQRLTIH
jgi:DNA-binding transcriptional LysR family regulator